MEKEITALYDRKNNVIMDWSPKVGCTILTKMFFRQMGLLDAAMEYHSWIHEYRMHVFYKNHPVTIDDIRNPSVFKFKVVRNPYLRAVSSYIHTMKKEVMHEPVRKALWRWNANISFKSFLRYLSKIDIHNCDPHYSLQKKFFEFDFPGCFNEIVYLENLESSIEEINKKHQLNFDLSGLTSHHHSKIAGEISGNAFKLRWNKIKDSIPEYKYFYNEEVAEKVYGIYKEDFETYGFSVADFPK